MYPLGQNVEGTIFREYMDPRKLRQLSIVGLDFLLTAKNDFANQP